MVSKISLTGALFMLKFAATSQRYTRTTRHSISPQLAPCQLNSNSMTNLYASLKAIASPLLTDNKHGPNGTLPIGPSPRYLAQPPRMH